MKGVSLAIDEHVAQPLDGIGFVGRLERLGVGKAQHRARMLHHALDVGAVGGGEGIEEDRAGNRQ